jgi:hypothetical protein
MLVVRDRRYQLVFDFRGGSPQLFDLRNDPDLRSPLSPTTEKTVRKQFLEVARAHIASTVKGRDSGLRLSACMRDLRVEWAAPVPPAGDG